MTDGKLGKIAWSTGGGDRAGDGARSGGLVWDGMRKRAGVLSGSRPDPRQGRGPDQVGGGRRDREDRLGGEEIGGERWRRACAGRFCIWNGNRCGPSTGATCGAR